MHLCMQPASELEMRKVYYLLLLLSPLFGECEIQTPVIHPYVKS